MYELISKSEIFLYRKEIFFGQSKPHISIFTNRLNLNLLKQKKTQGRIIIRPYVYLRILSGKIG